MGRKHTPETRAKLSEIAKKRRASELTKRKMSESKKGEKNSFYGKHHKPESKALISQNKKGQKARLGAKHKPESIQKMSEVKLGNRYSAGHIMPEESKQKLSKDRMGRKWSDKSRQKMSTTYKKKWGNPEYAEQTIEKSHLAMSDHPNKPETFLTNLLDEMYPNEFKFVGDDKSYRMGRKTPDFIHVSRNLIIEHFGVYPHGEKVRCHEETEEGRIAHFAKFGYKVLVIWDVELYNQLNIVKWRIMNFYNEF